MAKGIKGSTPTQEERPVRTSFNIKPALMEKVRHVGFFDKKDLTALVSEGLEYIVSEFESRKGKIKVK